MLTKTTIHNAENNTSIASAGSNNHHRTILLCLYCRHRESWTCRRLRDCEGKTAQ